MQVFRIAAAVIAAGLVGCVTYTPVAPAGAAPGEHVRVSLTRDGSTRIGEILGGDIRTLEGEVLDETADGLLVAVMTGVRRLSRRQEVLHQRVLIPRVEVAQLERREFDRFRTAAVAAGGAAIVGFVAWGAFSGTFGGGTNRPGDGPAEVLVPLFRVPLP